MLDQCLTIAQVYSLTIVLVLFLTILPVICLNNVLSTVQ